MSFFEGVDGVCSLEKIYNACVFVCVCVWAVEIEKKRQRL